jgi:hypothetical protein
MMPYNDKIGDQKKQPANDQFVFVKGNIDQIVASGVQAYKKVRCKDQKI